jgi:putative lipoprotein
MKRLVAMVLGLGLLLLPCEGAAGDEWLGPDKAAHFLVTLGLSSAGFGLSLGLAPQRPELGWAVGGAAGLGAGLGKECLDAGRGGSFSGRDLVWDLAGTLSGLLVSQGVYLLWQ